MAPQTLRGYAIPSNLPPYQQYSTHMSQIGGQHSNLPPPGNHSFMTQSSAMNPFNGSLSLAQGFAGAGGAIGGPTGLGSHDAQMRFHGGNVQPSSAVPMFDGARSKASKARIREVWRGNLQEEMEVLRSLVDKFPYISMDTEFPGVVARPMGSFRGKSDYHYQTLRANVDLLKLIQLGITLFDEEGRMVPERPQTCDSSDLEFSSRNAKAKNGQVCTWQFNFTFSLEEDMYAENSILALQQAGVDFKRHATEGIDVFDFGAALQTSGLVCFDDVRWISFHGGYDFGYLTKLMLRDPLPDDEVDFEMLMRKFFPCIYDVKFLLKNAIKLHAVSPSGHSDPSMSDLLAKFEAKSSLDNVADLFRVDRIGKSHQGGSDAYVTGKVFFELKRRIYDNNIGPEQLNKVWGLGFPDSNALTFSHAIPSQYSQSQTDTNIGSNGYNGGAPSTPINSHARPATATPAHSSASLAPLTPGGQFGQFRLN